MRVTGPSIEHLDQLGDEFVQMVDRGIDEALRIATKDLKATHTPDDLAAVITRVFTDYTNTTLLPHLAKSYQQAITDQAARVDAASKALTAAIILPPPPTTLADNYLATASNRLKGISDEVWQHTRSELLAGQQAGESIPQLRKRVMATAKVAKPRADVIARTEVIGAQNRGSLGQMTAAGYPGDKTWLATPDTSTRPTHKRANQQTVKITELFSVGGVSMDGPHDPSAPPGETINCRCTLTYQVGDDAVSQATEDALWPEMEHDDGVNLWAPARWRSNPEAMADIRKSAKDYSFFNRDKNLIGIKRLDLMDEQKVSRLMSNVDKLLKDAPPKGDLRLIVDAMKDPHTYGRTVVGEPNIHLNWRLLMPDDKTPGYFNPKNFMPSAHTNDPIDYVTAHEWGHAIEPTHRQEQAGEDVIVQAYQQAVAMMNEGAAQEPPVDEGEMSSYAESDPSGDEAFAEFFAEWYLTPKGDWKGVLRTFAEEFGWAKASGE